MLLSNFQNKLYFQSDQECHQHVLYFVNQSEYCYI